MDTFLFGSKSRFNSLCWELVTEIKEIYPHLKRIYVRAEFPIIDNDYKAYLLNFYEDTYYPEMLLGTGRSVYIHRNCEIIDRSQYCILYYNKAHAPTTRKSGADTIREVILFPTMKPLD